MLIAGTTQFDQNPKALDLIRQEWASNNTYATRLSNLRNGAGALLDQTGVKLAAQGVGRTVFDDGSNDYLLGGSGRDWFFADLDRQHQDDDRIFRRDKNEEVDQLI